jgi:hypothetical protein
MELNYSIKRAAAVLGLLAIVSITAVAQENRSEVSAETGRCQEFGYPSQLRAAL